MSIRVCTLSAIAAALSGCGIGPIGRSQLLLVSADAATAESRAVYPVEMRPRSQ